MEKERKNKLSLGIISLIIIIMLAVSGPASAFSINFKTDQTIIKKGDIFNINATLQVDNSSKINNITLNLKGPENIVCKFYSNTSIIDGCDGIKIYKIVTENYGYSYSYSYDTGYGYNTGEKEVMYMISVNTTNRKTGTYTSNINVIVNGKTYEKKGSNIIIYLKSYLQSCSIRAKNGLVNSENKDFGNLNKINFFIANEKAKKGSGYITAQKSRTTFSYKFNFVDTIENNDNYALISVSGKYKIDGNKEKFENATIKLDKQNNTLSIYSQNIKVDNMRIDLKNGCKTGYIF